MGSARRARPKSETRASYNLVRRMFDDLMLPWEIVRPWECRNAIAWAAPRAMPDLVSQVNGVVVDPLLPAMKQWGKQMRLKAVNQAKLTGHS